MEVAAVIAIALLDYADFCLIIALLFLNATISYVEESNADKAIKALTAALAPKAKCLRDGTVSSIDAADLVPGDIVVVRLGEIVPADIKLMGETGEDDHPLQVCKHGFVHAVTMLWPLFGSQQCIVISASHRIS